MANQATLNKNRLENLADDVWKGAEKLRGKFKARDYSAIILPMIMIRRIECVLEKKRAEYRRQIIKQDTSFSEEAIVELRKNNPGEAKEKKATLEKRVKLLEINKTKFYNESNWTLKKVLEENATQIETNFREFLNSFSDNINDIIDNFDYRNMVGRMVKANRLASIIQLVAEKDFSPDRLSNLEMGYVYEHLLQKFSENDANETGEHFTPREIIRIMVDLMEIDFDPETSKEAISVYDPAGGTGGMLSIAKEHLVSKAETSEGIAKTEDLVLLNGQEILPQNYAICKADMIIKGEVGSNITLGNSLIPDIESVLDDGDQHAGTTFDYMLSNPPFGVNWSEYKRDAMKLKTARYEVGTPEVGDGALLFLLTMIEKMKPSGQGGSKIAILFNGSPLSNGDATQGESEIRRYVLEKDLLDTIVMLPDEMFYDTGIYTYIWLLNNNKPGHKKDRVLIINARDQFEKEPKSFGNKRNRITAGHRQWIQNQYENWDENEYCKKFHYTDFGFHKVEVVFWQENADGEQEWIEEEFDVKLTTANVKKRFELYGDFEMHITLRRDDEEHFFDIHYEGSKKQKGFGPLFRDCVQERFPKLQGKKVAAVKSFLNKFEVEATFTHRNYIVDTEYIPCRKEENDSRQHIDDFLHREINYEIIDWAEADELGYEILPNKYFYEYEEPVPSEELLGEFWQLEEEAEELLEEIRGL